MDAWTFRHGIQIEFIRPGKLRDECLNVNLFMTLSDARDTLEAWRRMYNEIRPHRSLGARPPN